MSEHIPAPIIVDGIFLTKSATFTQSTLLVEYKVKIIPYMIVMFVGLGFAILPFLSQDVRFICGGLVSAAIILFGTSEQRSYRYEFDKQHNEIRCKWVGFQGIHIFKRKDIIYALDDLSYIYVKQNSQRGESGFQLKVVLYTGASLDLPSGDSLAECTYVGNKYREFLEIEAPIQS